LRKSYLIRKNPLRCIQQSGGFGTIAAGGFQSVFYQIFLKGFDRLFERNLRNRADQFRRLQTTAAHRRPPNYVFFAGVVALGCELGVAKVTYTSKQLGETELENTVNRYFTLENLRSANQKLVEFLNSLEIPNLYRRASGKLHTSSDGQKYEVTVPSLNANYSFKYFGQNKGVSVYSFIDERQLLFYSTVISSSEREAAYVIDGLLHNETIKSDIHSTDSQGFTEVVFGVTHLLGFTFALRLKKLSKHRLYSFEKRKVYETQGFQILPKAYIDTKLIEENWDDILRFVATIKLKRTSASQLFKRLNSYSNQHPLYQALKEFGKIIKTLFILRYVDDSELRQSIEKQLNKIEHAQRFVKAIAFGNSQEVSQAEKEDQEITAECRRLIENSVIGWNYLYLTHKLTKSNAGERAELLKALKEGSIITWRHVNFYGEYDFSEDKLKDSIGFNLPEIVGWKMEEKRELKIMVKPMDTEDYQKSYETFSPFVTNYPLLQNPT
jgi:TnpA family transposase